MRATVRDLIIADTALTAFIPAERWFQLGSVLDVPVKPFAILRWITPVPGNASGSYAHQLRIELYEARGSYAKTDAALGGPYRTGGLYDILCNAFGVTGSDGYIAQADFLGNSGDDVNVDYKANMKYSSWQIIGKEL